MGHALRTKIDEEVNSSSWLVAGDLIFDHSDRSPGRYQELDLFIKVLRLLCPNLTDAPQAEDSLFVLYLLESLHVPAVRRLLGVFPLLPSVPGTLASCVSFSRQGREQREEERREIGPRPHTLGFPSFLPPC